ncbi:hypothetical protein HG537_0A07660 [Torulaspora globosa]|uniref:Cation/H+ exchanger transmembrane domain-containing protein n=1 Tax=Torulaspora globosa TaxID=48254 RepID=A0A7H9HMK6_9SACH|nr:hypothetical protein HG537_0A07660 [Torulaspora sp. CBS 2947]
MGTSVGGVISGQNPFIYETRSPVTLWLFQVCLILVVCNVVHVPFSKIRQPKVISEVIAGVILGPTVLGQIPNYTATVFPQESIVGLNLTANIGIILFMFFLGLEVDTGFIKKHLNKAMSIGLASLCVPFGFGCLFAVPLYNTYVPGRGSAGHVKFTVFMVYIAVSISVTAFPVLCRILNELNLIKERAGIVVLGGGIVNDILGWIMLALSVILSNASSNPVNTVYILLCTFGWFLFIAFPVKYTLRWSLLKTRELERSKPSPVATMCVLFIVFISAYFTDIIGVHPIFGAFMAGLIVPRENNYVVKLAERMEDIPNIVLIPIYFAVAGLNVDLTLLNEGKDWGYVFASIGIAISTKVVSGTIAARLHGLFLRESTAVGILLSCKGIVEIVVLTVGLNAGIITRKIFGMFVLMALVSTFVTTPLTLWVFPESYRNEIRLKKIDEKDTSEVLSSAMSAADEDKEAVPSLSSFQDVKNFHITEVINITNSIETISSSLELINSLVIGKPGTTSNLISVRHKECSRKPSNSSSRPSLSKVKKLTRVWSRNNDDADTALTVIEEDVLGFELEIPLRAVHLRQLTERTADLLQSSSLHNEDPDFPVNTDSLLQIFDIFARLSHIQFSSDVIFSTIREGAANIASMRMKPSDLILLPLRGAFPDISGTEIPPREHYAHFSQFYSHILGLNDLSSGFFGTISSSLKANFALLISNRGDRAYIARSKERSFHLLLPKPNMNSSDFLALHLLLLICHRNRAGGVLPRGTIYVNSMNSAFVDQLHELFDDRGCANDSAVNIQTINCDQKIQNDCATLPFIDTVLQTGICDERLSDFEENTVIIAESSFEGEIPFSEEVKNVMLRGANDKFNVLVVHNNVQDAR